MAAMLPARALSSMLVMGMCVLMRRLQRMCALMRRLEGRGAGPGAACALAASTGPGAAFALCSARRC